jgi:hypothetical protein
MSETVVEYVWGELADADGKTYNVQLDLTVRELFADERTMPVGQRCCSARAITHVRQGRA